MNTFNQTVLSQLIKFVQMSSHQSHMRMWKRKGKSVWCICGCSSKMQTANESDVDHLVGDLFCIILKAGTH